MKQYTCYTGRGKWNFEAYNDKDALRLALFYCWRDDEDFIKVEGYKGFIPYKGELLGFKFLAKFSSTPNKAHICPL